MTFRTCQPKECTLKARMYREPFIEGANIGKKYLSKVLIKGSEADQVYEGQASYSTHKRDIETTLIGVLDKTTS